MKPALLYPQLSPSAILLPSPDNFMSRAHWQAACLTPPDTIKKSNFRRAAKTLELPKPLPPFFLLGSRLRSLLIPSACHKYPCLLSQDLGWTWAGDPGGSQLLRPRSSCVLRTQPRASPETPALLILRNWAGAGPDSTNIYRGPITQRAWYHRSISVLANSPKALLGALISDRWGTWVQDEPTAWVTVNCGCLKFNELTYPI